MRQCKHASRQRRTHDSAIKQRYTKGYHSITQVMLDGTRRRKRLGPEPHHRRANNGGKVLPRV